MIYINQHELNVQYPQGVTPLTLCKDRKLRELMVMLGANPYYLDPTKVPLIERTQLKAKYKACEKDTHLLKKVILKTYLLLLESYAS